MSRRATTVIVAFAPDAIVPSLQEPAEHVPWEAVAETSVAPGGGSPVTTTPVAASGPWFVTVIVAVALPPADTTVGLTLFRTVRSADGAGDGPGEGDGPGPGPGPGDVLRVLWITHTTAWSAALLAVVGVITFVLVNAPQPDAHMQEHTPAPNERNSHD